MLSRRAEKMAVVVMLASVLCLFGAFPAVLSASGFDTVTSYSGSYEISINGKPWFRSAPPFVVANGIRYSINNSAIFRRQLPDMDKELLLKSADPRTGQDELGQFQGILYEYFAGETRIDLQIRTYQSAVVFSQTFPQGLQNPGIPDNRLILSGFPALSWDIVFNTATGYLTFHGDLTGDSAVTLDRWKPLEEDIAGGMRVSSPVCFFNTSSSEAVVVSPLTQPMHLSPWHRRWKARPHFIVTEGQSYWGIDRDLLFLPAGFKVEVILVYSPNGIGMALEDWGRMYRLYNRPVPLSNPPLTSAAVDKMGYWTGRGSYYTGKATANNTFEDILLGVERSAVNTSVPLGFFELDKWWLDSFNGTPDAVVKWEANNQSLPSGIRSFQQKLGLPLAVVCGWWSSSTTYAEQNNGSYAFILEGDYALPIEKEFWSDLFKNASLNNITHVIMDDMTIQYFGVTALQTQPGLASDWLRNMSSAAYDAGITLTLSKALPSILMEASRYPAVIQARVSAPYMDTSTTDQWKIGVTSALASALGLAAFKDTFWSHSHEAGNRYDDSGEKNPDLQALVATLSMGSVALGDSQARLASPVTDRCCRSDGVVLKPSRPATATDAQLIQTAVNGSNETVGQLWSTVSTLDIITYTNVTSSYSQGVIMAADMPGRFIVTPSAVFPGVYGYDRLLKAWSWVKGREHRWPHFSDSQPLSVLPTDCSVASTPALPCLIYVSPPLILNSGETVIHLGGENKFVPLSRQRVQCINVTNGVTLTLRGQPGENVTMFYYINDHKRYFHVTIDRDGVTDVDLDITSPTSLPPSSTTPTSPASAAMPKSLSLSALSLAVGFFFASRLLGD